ncbi:MAG: nucleoside kinase [Candidatus Eremiobacteraeota bacterium]|nr:nucleoside kinase [Candidatus Eremiobacteraeota bacterium]
MPEDAVKVIFADGREHEVTRGITVLDAARLSGHFTPYHLMGALVNNELKSLSEPLLEDSRVELLDGRLEEGRKIYRRSLSLVMIRAFRELFPDGKVVIRHSLSGGYFCKPSIDRPFTPKDLKALKARMDEIIARDEPFKPHVFTREEAVKFFGSDGQDDKARLFPYMGDPSIEVHSCGEIRACIFGKMVQSTGYLKVYDLLYYPPGFILRFPRSNNPLQLSPYTEQKKLFRVYYEYKQWVNLLGVGDVPALNTVIESGEINDLIRVAEALHEKKIAAIADIIAKNKEQLRVVLIAGPSASGKTTFAQRLAVQLRVNGIKPVGISVDDYFLDREKTPRDEKGDYNFEILEALDLELFNNHLTTLLMGGEVEIPHFDFTVGARMKSGRKLRIKPDQPLVIEGIHCLNDRLTESIARENKFKIYVSALTQLNLDDHNRINTTDTRILRRIVRDKQFRGRDALGTLKRWDSVRMGERDHIFPFQEEADIMFNSSLVYEFSVLKTFVEEPLKAIGRTEPEYSEAQRLLSILQFFLKVGTDEIPPNSIMREFIGATYFISADVPH